MSRSPDPARIAAELSGEAKYTSRTPCRRCGGTLRYTRNAICVSCALDKSTARWEAGRSARDDASGRAEAARAGDRKFTDRTGACACGCAIRYVKNGHCTACVRRRHRERAIAKNRERAIAQAQAGE